MSGPRAVGTASTICLLVYPGYFGTDHLIVPLGILSPSSTVMDASADRLPARSRKVAFPGCLVTIVDWPLPLRVATPQSSIAHSASRVRILPSMSKALHSRMPPTSILVTDV